MALSKGLNLRTAINKLCDARSRWLDIGIQLELDISELKSIEEKYRSDPDACSREMLNLWLKSSSQAPKIWSTLANLL